MNWKICGAVLVLLSMLIAVAAMAQTSEVKEKAPMYTYVASWAIPRAQWGEVEKQNATNKAILDKALSAGTLVGYGNDETILHQPEESTHDSWWSSMSLGGLLNVLDQFAKSPTMTSPVLASATKHSDSILMSRYYNWKPGPLNGAFTRIGFYKLKDSAPDNAVDVLAKNLVVPLLEKMLADGTIREYEIDEWAIHTENPGSFYIVYICPNADGLDKVNAALRESMKANPLGGPAFGSMHEMSAHRDELSRTTGVYK